MQTMKFADMFVECKPYTLRPGERRDTYHKGLVFSCYCFMSCVPQQTTKRYVSMQVKPSTVLMDWLCERMIRVNHDAIYFEVIIRADMSVSVYARYNQILGSRKISDVELDEIPTFTGWAK